MEEWALFEEEEVEEGTEEVKQQQQQQDVNYYCYNGEIEKIQNKMESFLNEHLSQTLNDFQSVLNLPELYYKLSMLFNQFHDFMRNSDDKSKIQALHSSCKDLISVTWEKHSSNRFQRWNHAAWREAFIFSKLVYVYSSIKMLLYNVTSNTEKRTDSFYETIRSLIHDLDLCIILGPDEIVDRVQEILAFLEPIYLSNPSNPHKNNQDLFNQKLNQIPVFKSKDQIPNAPKIKYPIQTIKNPTIEQFGFFWRSEAEVSSNPNDVSITTTTGTPVIIESGITNWEALKLWQNLENVNSRYFFRLVPVEIGFPVQHNPKVISNSNSNTTNVPLEESEEQWREETIEFSQFMEKFLIPSNHIIYQNIETHSNTKLTKDQVGYLAQSPLFNQFLELRKVVGIPKWCELGDHGGVKKINVWLGTCGTITPLHWDSYDNFLVQISGYKYVRLYDKKESKWMYTATTKDVGDGTKRSQGNVSQVVEVEDDEMMSERFEKMKQVKYVETILGPGEVLFIPNGWWHYVRSLTTSFSVNFWF